MADRDNIRQRKFERHKSVAGASDYPEIIPRPSLPDYNRSKTKICHQERLSLLSSGSGWDSFGGFLNLLKVIVGVSAFILNLVL